MQRSCNLLPTRTTRRLPSSISFSDPKTCPAAWWTRQKEWKEKWNFQLDFSDWLKKTKKQMEYPMICCLLSPSVFGWENLWWWDFPLFTSTHSFCVRFTVGRTHDSLATVTAESIRSFYVVQQSYWVSIAIVYLRGNTCAVCIFTRPAVCVSLACPFSVLIFIFDQKKNLSKFGTNMIHFESIDWRGKCLSI